MKRIYVALALVLPAQAAISQPLDTCIPGPQGTTSDCVIDSDPPILQDFGQGDFLNQEVPPEGRVLGEDDGVLAPNDGLDIDVGGVLGDDYDELDDPEAYGLSVDEHSLYYDTGTSAVRVDPGTREVLEVQPYAELSPQDPAVDVGTGAVDLDRDVTDSFDPDVATGLEPGAARTFGTDVDVGVDPPGGGLGTGGVLSD